MFIVDVDGMSLRQKILKLEKIQIIASILEDIEYSNLGLLILRRMFFRPGKKRQLIRFFIDCLDKFLIASQSNMRKIYNMKAQTLY